MNQNQKPKPAEVEEPTTVEETPGRFQTFVTNHPKAAKALGITTAVLAVVGVGTVTNTVRKNRSHLDAGFDHLADAGNEFGEAVSPSPEN